MLEEDASVFLAWINVGVAFKEQVPTTPPRPVAPCLAPRFLLTRPPPAQYMDPNQEEADQMAQNAASERRRKKTGLV